MRPQIPGLSPGGLGPHLTSSGFPLRAFLRFPVCPPGSSPSPAFLWLPFVRRSPVRSLRPLPGSGSPSVSLRVPFPLSNLHLSAAARRFRRRWSRAAGTNVTSSAATTPRWALSVLLCHLPGLPRTAAGSSSRGTPGMASIAGRSPAAEAGPLLALLSAQFPVTMPALAPRLRHGHLRNVHGLEACLASRWRVIVLGPVR